MDLLFLDANVLSSAAYRSRAGVRSLWGISDAALITSTYAVAEAERNLKSPEQRSDLEELLVSVTIVEHHSDPVSTSVQRVSLPDKDMPIMNAAVGSGATHLITGDLTHFGAYYGKTIDGILILPPAEYLARSSGGADHDDNEK